MRILVTGFIMRLLVALTVNMTFRFVLLSLMLVRTLIKCGRNENLIMLPSVKKLMALTCVWCSVVVLTIR